MTLPQALGLGVLQGITEFLPISSSGHLALAQALLLRSPDASLLFNVVVHLGTLLSILIVLRGRVLALIDGALSFLRRGPVDAETRINRRWVLLIVVASIPTALIGLAARDLVARMNLMPAAIGLAFLATAAVLVLSERFGHRSRDAAELGYTDAILVGVAQGFGVLPGVSRSGATIGAALWRGARAEVAVEFSVLISVPAVLGANLLEMLDAGRVGLGAEIVPLAAGFGAAFVTGIGALKALQWVVSQRRLLPFAAYTALLGVGAIALG